MEPRLDPTTPPSAPTAATASACRLPRLLRSHRSSMPRMALLVAVLLLFSLISTAAAFWPPPPIRRRAASWTRRSCHQHQHPHHHHQDPPASLPPADLERHQHYMGLALEEAQAAAAAGEIPVGAVLVSPDGRVLSRGRNRVEASGDASAHAELECLRAAVAARPREEGHWRMLDCTLYVTLEPCLMCLGAIQSFRVRRVVYGARNRLLGAVESFLPVLERPHPFHQVEAVGGVRAEECGAVMKDFFAVRRLQGWQAQERPSRQDEAVERERVDSSSV